MAYRLIITEHAEELIDKLIYYLIFHLKSEQAATHLLDELEKIYDRLEYNPLQFPISQNTYLAHKGFHEAIIPNMNYTLIFKIINNTIYIMGLFHQLENYEVKL